MLEYTGSYTWYEQSNKYSLNEKINVHMHNCYNSADFTHSFFKNNFCSEKAKKMGQ